jgi:hypothetical protein
VSKVDISLDRVLTSLEIWTPSTWLLRISCFEIAHLRVFDIESLMERNVLYFFAAVCRKIGNYGLYTVGSHDIIGSFHCGTSSSLLVAILSLEAFLIVAMRFSCGIMSQRF